MSNNGFCSYNYKWTCKDIRFHTRNSEVSYDELMEAVPAWRGMTMQEYDDRKKHHEVLLLKSKIEKRLWLNLLIKEVGKKDAIEKIKKGNFLHRKVYMKNIKRGKIKK